MIQLLLLRWHLIERGYRRIHIQPWTLHPIARARAVKGVLLHVTSQVRLLRVAFTTDAADVSLQMLCLRMFGDMFPQALFICVALVAGVTAIGLVSHMGPKTVQASGSYLGTSVHRRKEIFIVLWSYSDGKRSKMSPKVKTSLHRAVKLPEQMTCKGSKDPYSPGVGLEIGELSEGLAAAGMGTFVRLLSSMSSHMLL